MNTKFLRSLLSVALWGTISAATFCGDWPQWNGPHRDGVIEGSGWITEIPKDGLRKLWSAPVAGGYSGPAVAKGRVYVSDFVRKEGTSTNNPGARDQLSGEERIHCFDEKTGKELWSFSEDRKYALSYAAGPRVTPTIDDGLVYFQGAEGHLICLNASDGKLVWKRDLKTEYQTEAPIWGYSSAPLILGQQLICLAGGKGSIVVSLDKKTGKEIWKALSASETGYCPPTLIRAANVDQLLIWDADNLNALEPTSGKVLWSQPLQAKYGMSIAAPVIQGDKLFVSGIGEVGALFELDRSKPGATVLWKGTPKTALYSANTTPVIDGDYIYGCDCGKGSFVCAKLSDGTRMWESMLPTAGGERRASHGTAFINKLGKNYLLFSETGDLILANLNPEKYEELGRTNVIKPTNDCFGRAVVWSYPAYANQCLFVRNDEEVVCYSLAK